MKQTAKSQVRGGEVVFSDCNSAAFAAMRLTPLVVPFLDTMGASNRRRAIRECSNP